MKQDMIANLWKRAVAGRNEATVLVPTPWGLRKHVFLSFVLGRYFLHPILRSCFPERIVGGCRSSHVLGASLKALQAADGPSSLLYPIG